MGEEGPWAFLWRSSPKRPRVSQLVRSRRAGDAAIAAYERGSAEGVLARQALIAQLRKIPRLRDAIDSGSLSAPAAFQAYSNIVDGLFAVYIANKQSDISLYQHTLAAIDAGRALEQLSRELTLVAGAELAGGHMSPTDGKLFSNAVANQNLLVNDAITQSDPELRASLRHLYSTPLHRKLAALESRIAASAHDQAISAATFRAWGSVSAPFLGLFLAVANGDARPLAAQAGKVGSSLFREAGLAGGLGLIAVLAALFLMVRFGRLIREELTALHDGADVVANKRLPGVIERLRAGDELDVAAESPPLATGKITEVVRVAEAISSLQHIAVDAAVGQANLRKGVNRVFLNMSLRNQSLLHRQLGMLDAMERATNDPTALADLFRLDHLTTRMRRNAESRRLRFTTSYADAVPGAVSDFGRRCQREVVRQDDARTLARAHGIQLEGLGGSEDGVIGALAAVGLLVGGYDGRVFHVAGWGWPDPFAGPQRLEDVLRRGVDEVRDITRDAPVAAGVVDVGKHVRPGYRGRRVGLFVEPCRGDGAVSWRAVKLP